MTENPVKLRDQKAISQKGTECVLFARVGEGLSFVVDGPWSPRWPTQRLRILISQALKEGSSGGPDAQRRGAYCLFLKDWEEDIYLQEKEVSKSVREIAG